MTVIFSLLNFKYFQDIDECSVGSHNCGERAQCLNKHGSFECKCETGYAGSDCHDIDECRTGSHTCDNKRLY